MKTTLLSFILSLNIVAALAQMPQMKVDVTFSGRSDQEVLEPGYEKWAIGKDLTSIQTEINGVTFEFALPASASGFIRSGWNKTFINNADVKAKNGRLTGDGLTLDPNACGEFLLKIKGLPAGTHTIQTYHNRWEDPAQFVAWPIYVSCNGAMVHTAVTTTQQESVAANATVLTTVFTVASSSDEVVLGFSTKESDVKDYGGKVKFDRAPVINGFELNTTAVDAQAKEPYPTSGDTHVDADDGTCVLTWTPANDKVVRHLLYFGTDSVSVAQATKPMVELQKLLTSYVVEDLYTLNTYWWRVDEVDADGNVTTGAIWSFRPRHLAFPGAEGYGRYAHGGRGGVVYHVTNLKHDHSPGSFLYGVTDVEGPRTIVFDVSGIIEMDLASFFVDKNVTIAGQTAPGKGICLKYSNMNIGSDDICRFLRVRRGYGDTGNAMGCTGADHAIIDHTTAAWGTDETFSSRGAKNITFQYSIIAEALGIADHKNYSPGTNHGYAATIDGKIGTYSHNLLVDCNGRNWSMGGGMDGQNKAIGQMDIFNNVVYNWKSRTTDGNCHEVNFVNNYYKMGPATSQKKLFIQQYENIGTGPWQAYVSGNIRENKDHSLTHDKKGDTYDVQLSNGATMPDYPTVVSQPFFPSYALIESATDAFKSVTSSAGATMPCRDDQHVRLVGETINGTYTYVGSRSGIKGEIDHENDCGGFEAFPEETRPADFDTDQDGIPNWYELLVGSNPDVANNNDDPDRDGYTMLEDYLEFMAHPYLILAPGETKTFDVSAEFRGYTKSPVYSYATASSLFTPSLSGNVITVKAGASSGLDVITLKVTDAEGSTWTQRLGIAVTGETSGISSIYDESDMDIVKREFYTLDGKQVSTMRPHDTYVMKVTDANGKEYVTKIIKN